MFRECELFNVKLMSISLNWRYLWISSENIFFNGPVVTFQDKTDIQVCLWKVKLVVQNKKKDFFKSDFLRLLIFVKLTVS